MRFGGRVGYVACGYIIHEGHRRNSPPEDCDKYIDSKGKRTYLKEYYDTAKQRIYPENSFLRQFYCENEDGDWME